ncbi:DNA-binding Lrp family transcriptional regulator [Streptacidiphilus sp. MAP12-16]
MPAEQMVGPGEPRPARRSGLPALQSGPAAEWVAERARQRAASASGAVGGRMAAGASAAKGQERDPERHPDRNSDRNSERNSGRPARRPGEVPGARPGGRTDAERTGDPAAGGAAAGGSAARSGGGTGGSVPGFGSADASGGHRQLDRIDRAILRLLQQDGRASIRSVAERVHVSRANAYARIARMVEDGVIRGFTARVNHERAGQGASAYITLKIVQNSWRTVRGQLLELPGIEHIALVSGEFDVIMLVHTVDNRALRELVLNRIQSIPEVLGTHTLLVFDETDRTPVLPD